MAWCLKCNKNVQIVVSTHTSTHDSINTTELFKKSEYEVMRHKVGEFESEQTYTSTETIPRCSNCYSVLHYPGAQTAEEINNIYKEQFLRWKTREISRLKNEIHSLEHLPSKDNSFETGCLIIFLLLAIEAIVAYILFNTGHWFWAIVSIIVVLAIFNFLSDSGLIDFDDNKTAEYNRVVALQPNLPKLKAELEKMESCQYTGYNYEKNQFCHN